MNGKQKHCDFDLPMEDWADAFECKSGWWLSRSDVVDNGACDCPECEDEINTGQNCTTCGACPTRCGESANCTEKFGECEPPIQPWTCPLTPEFKIEISKRDLELGIVFGTFCHHLPLMCTFVKGRLNVKGSLDVTAQWDVKVKRCRSQEMSKSRDVKAKGCQSQEMSKPRDVQGNGCQRQWMSKQSQGQDVKGNGYQRQRMSKPRDVKAKAKRCQSQGMSKPRPRDVKAKRCQRQWMSKATDVKAKRCQRQWMSKATDVKAKGCHSQGMSKAMGVKAQGFQSKGVSKQRASFSDL